MNLVAHAPGFDAQTNYKCISRGYGAALTLFRKKLYTCGERSAQSLWLLTKTYAPMAATRQLKIRIQADKQAVAHLQGANTFIPKPVAKRPSGSSF